MVNKAKCGNALILSLLLLAGIILYATPSFALKSLGTQCAAHQECTSGRCDNRPQSGCVPQDGTGNSGEFCSTHQQCKTGLCNITPGRYTGVCSGGNRALGQQCMTHQECKSGRCDNRPQSGCVPQDGTGNSGEFCSTHQQCRTGLCNITPGRYTGVCSGGSRALGQQCMTHQECKSLRCDNRPGSGCVPQDGTGNPGDFCSTHQQCRSQVCTIAPGKIAGQCSSTTKTLGTSCLSHNECVTRRCDNRPGAGCVSQDGAGKANEFCTTHQQCSSGYCQITSGLRGTCSAGNQAIGKPCHASSECTSKFCNKGICAQPGPPPQPPTTSSCPGAKFIQGYTYIGQPSCAGVLGSYLRCDARGYFCCASSAGSQSPRCGAGKYEFQPGCSQYNSGGGSNIGPLLKDGIFYGCYRTTP